MLYFIRILFNIVFAYFLLLYYRNIPFQAVNKSPQQQRTSNKTIVQVTEYSQLPILDDEDMVEEDENDFV